MSDYQDFLEMLTYRGAQERYGIDPDGETETHERIRHELGIIKQAGFASYFLIVWDIMRFCRDSDIPVGPGRGSVCGSVVAYCTRIIDVDPLRWDIPFERFLHLGRNEQPDIDLDICAVRRDEVMVYLRQRYNKHDDELLTAVAQIATFGTLMAKGVVRDVCRVLNVDEILYGVHANETGEKLSKLIPEGSGADQIVLSEWKDSGAHEGEWEVFWERMERVDAAYQKKTGISVWDCCLRLEGNRRHSSSHAAGVVIADRPLVEIVPLAKKNKDADIQIQYDMKDAEEIGLLKMDVLGLRTVSVIGEAERLIRRDDPDFSMLDVEIDDDETFALLNRDDMLGVFQLEGQGIGQAMRGIEPDDFEDIIALLALYRPGPMEQLGNYARRKLGREEVEYLFPELEPILGKTYGLMVYQEQVMAIARLLAGYDPSEADKFRKAIGKKDVKLIDEQIGEFVKRAKEQGWDEERVDELGRQIRFFGRYGFNRGHATGYAFITYWTAWLKVHHPGPFYTAILNSYIGDTGRIGEFLLDAEKHGITVRVPDINRSGTGFSLSEDGDILFGLEAVKGVGEKAARDIIEYRDSEERTEYGRKRVTRERLDEETGKVKRYKASILDPQRVENEPRPYDDLWDFCARLTHIPIPAKKALIEAGAFGEDYKERALFLEHADDINKAAKKGKEYHIAEPPRSFDQMEMMRREKDVLGFYITTHPLQEYRRDLERYGAIADGDFDRMRKAVCIAGVVMTIKTHNAKNGEMAWITLENGINGMPRVTVFADAWGPASSQVTVGDVVVVTGRKDYHKKFGWSIIADTVLPIRKDIPEAQDRVLVALPDPDIGHMAEIRTGCGERGQSLALVVVDGDRYALVATDQKVLPTGSWIQAVEGGSGLVRFDYPTRGPYDWIDGPLVRKEGHHAGSGDSRIGVWELPLVQAALKIFGGKVVAELEKAE